MSTPLLTRAGALRFVVPAALVGGLVPLLEVVRAGSLSVFLFLGGMVAVAALPVAVVAALRPSERRCAAVTATIAPACLLDPSTGAWEALASLLAVFA